MKWTNELLDRQRLIQDPVADELVNRLVEEFGSDQAKRFFEILIRNIDIPFDQVPPYVKDYIDKMAYPPANTDLARVRKGQQVFYDLGAVFALILYFRSLPTTYLDWRGCEVLRITGRLDSTRSWPDTYARRVGETTQFLLDAMTAGSLDPHGKGVQTVLKVRLVHASIRHFVSRHPDWDESKLGKPINQEDLAYTLLTFGLAMVEGIRLMKIPMTDEQAEDYHYAWKVVGHYLGIDPNLIPENLSEAREQMKVMEARLHGPSEAGTSCTKALVDFSKQTMLPGELFDNTPEHLIRYFIGDEKADLLGLPHHKGCLSFLPIFLAKYLGALEKVEDRGLGLQKAGNKIGIGIVKAFMKRFRSIKGRGLEMPEDLEAAWGIAES